MKILVIEDNELHRQAAKAQLAGHELTIAATYEEGEKLLEIEYDIDSAKREVDKAGTKNRELDGSIGIDWDYRKAVEKAQGRCFTPTNFEVVLVDLLMPPSVKKQNMGKEQYRREEMPVGIFLALLAAKAGAKYVALLTDINHHAHPASACIDPFNPRGGSLSHIAVESATLVLTNSGSFVSCFRPGNLAEEVPWEVQEREGGSYVWAKNWQKLLDCLLEV